MSTDLFVDEESFAKSLGDLYIYELTATDEKDLQLGFLFGGLGGDSVPAQGVPEAANQT